MKNSISRFKASAIAGESGRDAAGLAAIRDCHLRLPKAFLSGSREAAHRRLEACTRADGGADGLLVGLAAGQCGQPRRGLRKAPKPGLLGGEE